MQIWSRRMKWLRVPASEESFLTNSSGSVKGKRSSHTEKMSPFSDDFRRKYTPVHLLLIPETGYLSGPVSRFGTPFPRLRRPPCLREADLFRPALCRVRSNRCPRVDSGSARAAAHAASKRKMWLYFWIIRRKNVLFSWLICLFLLYRR